MRKLIALVLVLATLYGGYWFVGRSQIQSRLTDAIVQVDAGEMNVTYTSLATRGFPSRFDTTVTDLVVEDPIAGVRWETPILQLLALSYQPNNVRAYFPEEQVFVIDGDRYTLFTNEMVASGRVSASAALAVQQAELELLNPRLRTEDGAELALARLFAAMRLTPDTTQSYDVFFEARSIVLPENIRNSIDPQNLQPPIIQSLRLDSDVTLSEPIALNSADAGLLSITTLSIKELALAWGDMSVSVIGDVSPDEAGVLDGSITITARNWQQALDLAVASGVLEDDRIFLVTEIANNFDETPHIPDTLTVTLSIVNGEMALGGFALGPAPLLR
ncbi:hypothetical protein DUF2125 [Octadecabacter arcticus 238]|uniref:DUF2125 domain-containing protein n=1 Tax=Octadecabacter arcticus 238 TaxID=391616 RepID=M9RK45_9RHOB|nr:DUF2125 domain-containing protein [Octadecabacter arcticus]AGI70756.1 hypothetical protein DUF2125 [Octadecabacter arcticus 238]